MYRVNGLKKVVSLLVISCMLTACDVTVPVKVTESTVANTQETVNIEEAVTNTQEVVTNTQEVVTSTQGTGYNAEQAETAGTVSENFASESLAVITLHNGVEIPWYTDRPYIEVNDNEPYFTADEIIDESYEYYSHLDDLGRCGEAKACIGLDIMPTEKRVGIGQVKPTGWHTVKYDCVDGKYLYNRCHLIGYQLAGENANEQNLITGTRYMNVDGMLPFENKIADYIEQTGNHVLYRVTPEYSGDNLIAYGVLMEAYSVEDTGESIYFNVFCYNTQPGVVIDYATGESRLEGTSDVAVDITDIEEVEEELYILNTNTKKYHKVTCGAVEDIKAENREEYTGDSLALVDSGYSPCGRCKP